jgi:hypothetical protein
LEEFGYKLPPQLWQLWDEAPKEEDGEVDLETFSLLLKARASNLLKISSSTSVVTLGQDSGTRSARILTATSEDEDVPETKKNKPLVR